MSHHYKSPPGTILLDDTPSLCDTPPTPRWNQEILSLTSYLWQSLSLSRGIRKHPLRPLQLRLSSAVLLFFLCSDWRAWAQFTFWIRTSIGFFTSCFIPLYLMIKNCLILFPNTCTKYYTRAQPRHIYGADINRSGWKGQLPIWLAPLICLIHFFFIS